MGLDESIKQAKSRIDIYRDALPAAPKTLGQTAMAAFIAEQEVLLAELTRLRVVEREQRALMDLFDRRLIYFDGELWYVRLRDLAMLSDAAIVQMLRPYFEEAQDDE